MSSSNVTVDSILACLQLASVPLAALALVLCVLIFLWRRLAGSRSCEGRTGPEQHHSSTKSRTGTAPFSASTIGDDKSLLQQQASNWTHKEDMIKYPKQPYDAFLVLDVEGTCVEGSGFDYPNEIIEWPVCLLRWRDKNARGKARVLEVVDEFRSFVRPTWRPQLTSFCTTLTGITQEQVDSAPTFPEVLQEFRTFLEKNKLIDHLGQRLVRFCFSTDGPHDIRDFVVKQCFISKIPVPVWLTWDIMDVRRAVGAWHDFTTASADRREVGAFPLPRRVTLSIPRQLHALGLEPFEGRQHSGIDDTRNICRLVVELARRGWKLEPNTPINPNRRWPWMGKRGKVLEEYYS